jgi:hypothetical protein
MKWQQDERQQRRHAADEQKCSGKGKAGIFEHERMSFVSINVARGAAARVALFFL